MNLKPWLLGILAGTVAFFAIDFVLYGVIMKDMMAEWQAKFATIGYAQGQGPSEMWIILFELVRGIVVAMVIFQKPLLGMSAFLWGAIFGALFALGMDFWWVMTFPIMDMSMVSTDVLINGIVGGLGAWIMSWVYTKMA